MLISVVIPTYNEKENIQILVDKLIEIFNSNNIQGNIVIVDDNSPDGTGKIADELAVYYKPLVHVIHRSGKLGIGTAHIAGFKYSLDKLNADLIFSMDSDLSHNPEYLPDFVKLHNRGYDIIVGSRYVKGGGVKNWGLHRKIVSKGANMLASTILGIKINDMTTGYRCYSRNVLQKLDLDVIKSNGYSFLEEILYYCKRKRFKIGETPIIFVDRTLGSSKLSKNEMAKFFMTILRLRFQH
ncbi:dolichol-phosphate mannosyltransferase [Methanolobus vulcani]|uniref:Dolichol-phosphate mannosyltransferase n=1 Tax=Methanolobus vulcani TaxID=38026 RepID=A0A7Z7AVJ9_9EURY|nr:polyprenol monophosphomannose synthase [Methanolobus vulcani]SDF58615.1 dolichol-phosphate mannosyltransferase [Methanolobus vulcani]